jgi:hypothetical protein
MLPSKIIYFTKVNIFVTVFIDATQRLAAPRPGIQPLYKHIPTTFNYSMRKGRLWKPLMLVWGATREKMKIRIVVPSEFITTEQTSA